MIQYYILSQRQSYKVDYHDVLNPNLRMYLRELEEVDFLNAIYH